GNVLFYILIGVALLAALSYAVSRTNRGSADSVSRERTKIATTEILEYADIIGNAVSQLRLRGIADTQISFENEAVSGYENSRCAQDGCRVFALDGGGVSYAAPKSEWLDGSYSDEPHYGELYFSSSAMGLDKGQNDRDDLIMFIPYLKKAVCVAVNEGLNIPLKVDATPSESKGPFKLGEPFTGEYSDLRDAYVSGDNTVGQSDILSSFNAGCTKGTSGGGGMPQTGSYHFYKVLIAR
ncbi:MAG: hypothetical protein ACLFRA_06035, partial [Alphaproteobacteria bacterium]